MENSKAIKKHKDKIDKILVHPEMMSRHFFLQQRKQLEGNITCYYYLLLIENENVTSSGGAEQDVKWGGKGRGKGGGGRRGI